MKNFWHTYAIPSVVHPGKMDKDHFYKLIEISGIHSQKIIHALEDYCVNGNDRKDACAKHNVSQGYFSICLKRFQLLNKSVIELLPHYMK
ncbi:transcriptional regulator [Escherichia coli]|uniref:PapB/FocB family fimbrial expression transcriptional regulator n=1 Tax=Escherichia coli TaxID=562 RepID=UPI00185C9A35|nr:PapB/FocB family fimbrial expression transcriptional regulator [Escherichia coli]EKR8371111.1 transcriptional regulator [Escherichia coli]MBA2192103.1 transcriptional regulator [Escherichia coli]HAW3652031.1 transcriptional regulator [Escherichia coli]HAW8424063.1 transcriptional regulator [Escherichia coli]